MARFGSVRHHARHIEDRILAVAPQRNAGTTRLRRPQNVVRPARIDRSPKIRPAITTRPTLWRPPHLRPNVCDVRDTPL
jgi:hypothetical protein